MRACRTARRKIPSIFSPSTINSLSGILVSALIHLPHEIIPCAFIVNLRHSAPDSLGDEPGATAARIIVHAPRIGQRLVELEEVSDAFEVSPPNNNFRHVVSA